jgi:mono/diheme cytochrome c family protein
MRFFRILAYLPLFLFPENSYAAQPQVDVEELRPGLVARYADGAQTVVTQLDPIPALSLKENEAPHPRMRADGGETGWQGYINLLRAGDYRFGATLRGTVRVLIGGKVVFAAKATEPTPERKEGMVVRLEAGAQAILVEFTRPPGVARLELYWKAPHISEEPLSRDVLFHLPAKASLTRERQIERGRFLVEEYNCAGCHLPAESDRLARGLHKRLGPDLSQVGKRARPGWLYQYLRSPQDLSPASDMPHFFDTEEVECYAVTRYLESLGGPLRDVQIPGAIGQVELGKRLFHSVGCSVCHPEGTAEKTTGREGTGVYSLHGEDGASARHPFPDLHAKTSLAALTDFLSDPLAVRPGGRMPNMVLSKKEANALARYLGQQRPDTKALLVPSEPAAADREKALVRYLNIWEIQALPAGSQWVELGRRVVGARNCVACHAIAPGGRPLSGTAANASFDAIKEVQRTSKGCLAANNVARGNAPRFALSVRQREEIAVFLHEGARGAGSPAPSYHARVTLQRFNCLACHQRDGEGGLSPALIEDLRKYEKAENSETLTPPSLNEVGHKLQTPWFRKVLSEAGRARPWMSLRMPQFGAANVGQLPEGIAALEGTTPQDASDRAVAPKATVFEQGRHLVGKGAFGCISCHDIAGVVTGGTRGPDLATTNQRVRYPWFRRWLESAQRMHPGTKMPTVFPEGRSLMEKVLGGNANAQSEAMWAYLGIGPTLPLPDGLEVKSEGTILAALNRPVLLRTFLHDAGTRAVAVGYPGGISAVFDSTQCRLAYAWSGGFLDVGPVWNNRGGAPAKVLGTRFWTSPPGFPWSVARDWPRFDEQSKDPAFGIPLPEGQVYQGSPKLFCDGYLLDKEGLPTFLYRVAAGKDVVRIGERPEPIRGPLANGISRQFALEIPAKEAVWFFAGTGAQNPEFLDAKGVRRVSPDIVKTKNSEYLQTSADRVVVLPQADGTKTLLQLGKEEKDLFWHSRQESGGRWSVYLVMPASADAQRRRIEVRVLVPHQNEMEVLRELLSRKG